MRLIYFEHILGGGLKEKGGLFNSAKTMVLVLHKDLEYIVKKLKNNKLDVMQPRIENSRASPKFQQVNKLS